MKIPLAFRAASGHAGIKRRRPDLALFCSGRPCAAAGVFTSNRVAAWPVRLSREATPTAWAQAVAVNSGNANCANGPEGLRAARRMRRAAANALGMAPARVLIASTGVIGRPFPTEKVEKALPILADRLSPSPAAFRAAAGAILTTDTRRKISFRTFRLGGRPAILWGCAKGAGMIHPDFGRATMICVLLTDAGAEPRFLQSALAEAAGATFGRVTIDGDTSTNDTVFLLANGASGGSASSARARACFAEALEEVCGSLARQIAADGEGAKRLIHVEVFGGRTAAESNAAARVVAGSLLVKTAVYGGDPNWGRVLAALGRCGVPVEESRVTLWMGGIAVFRRGRPVRFDRAAARRALRQKQVHLRCDLGRGRAYGEAFTCDLTPEYVRLNAEYS